MTLFGLAAVFTLPIRSSPIIPTRYFDISTNFPGADAATIDRFVTRPFEGAVASVEGIKYVTGTSILGNSDLNAFIQPNADPGTLFNKVLAAVNGARGNLPDAVLPATVKMVGDDGANQEFSIAVMFPPTLPVAEGRGLHPFHPHPADRNRSRYRSGHGLFPAARRCGSPWIRCACRR